MEMVLILSIESANKEISGATALVTKSDIISARDKCVRAASLVEFSSQACLSESFSSTLSLILSILNELIIDFMQRSPNDNYAKDTGWDSCIIDHKNNFSVSTSTYHFKDVIGNETAKQALYENVILQRKLGPDLK